MFLPVLSGLVVSVDAFFIGLSLGLRKKCRFLHLAVINVVLFGLCMLGFFLAGQIYAWIPFDADVIVGVSFILLGCWSILHCCIAQRRKKDALDENTPRNTIILVGLVMSAEAMLITMGITLIFLPERTLWIPLTVALAHFGYSALSFRLARVERLQRVPAVVSHVVSGLALITYGLMALFVELGV